MSIKDVPADTDKNFKSLFQKYIVTELNPWIANSFFNDRTPDVFLAEYQKDKVQAIVDTELAMLKALVAEMGVIDFRVTFAAGNIIVSILADYAQSVGLEPVTADDVSQATQLVLKTFLQMNKGKYDPYKLQMYLADLKKQSEGDGEFAQILAQGKAKAAQQSADSSQQQPAPSQTQEPVAQAPNQQPMATQPGQGLL
jgi:hypothetical protein